jgi:hypothetical protein
MYFVALCLCISAVQANSVASPEKPFILSSAVSPDGVWIAENFGTNDCCSGGFVLIHKKSEPSSPSDRAISSASTAPGLFMIWLDDKRLSLVQDSNDVPVNGPTMYKGITLVYSTYHNRASDSHTFDTANASKRSVSIKEPDATSEAATEVTKTGRRCTFSLSASDGTVYDKIGMRIEASVNRCNRTRDCAGISSQFWIGKRVDGQHGVALTSATVSNIPSYNRLPEGDRTSTVRGSFGESGAVDLVAALSSEAIDIQYSLNFFDAIILYRIETKQIASSVKSFKACIGDGDFNWLPQEKTKPKSSVHPE